MTPEQFTYWLQGFLEVSDAKKLDEKQLQVVRDHLKAVFVKVTPDRSLPYQVPNLPSQAPLWHHIQTIC